ncbi:MAG: O-methyltransferase [Haloarculaceae archaeon]
MTHPVPAALASFAVELSPPRDEIVREMDARAAETDFPTVGPAVGTWFRLLADLVDASQIFEFGSGFGYSAYWFARALPADGEVVLTEVDADELATAREYFERAGLADRARFEHGDALETVESYDGPFDVVLVDNEKDRYVEAFDAVRDRIAPGGLVLADNALTAGSTVEFEGVRALLGSGDDGGAGPPGTSPDGAEKDGRWTEGTRGIADYLAHVRAADGFRTTLLPLGEGVAVSYRVPAS